MKGNKRTRKKRFLKIRLAAGLLAVLLLLGGCSASSRDLAQQGIAFGEGSAASGGMGRYIEEEISVTYEEYYPVGLLPVENGVYLARDQGMDELVAADSSETTVQMQLPEAFRSIAKEQDIVGMAVAENGARMFSVYEKGEQDETVRNLKYFLTAEGELQEWNDYVEDGQNVYYWYGRDGYFYVSAIGGDSPGYSTALYRVDVETGETEYLWDFPSAVTDISVCKDYLFAGYDDGLMIYSLSGKEQLSEDSVLTESLKKYLGDAPSNNSHPYLIAASQTEEGIYVLTEAGLFYHVMYGTVMEQVIEGSLGSIGDISKQFAAMCVAENETGDMPDFYLTYDSGKLVRFVYDADVPSVPDTMVRVYSLHEDSNMRQAVTGYQGEHPEVYVQYEVGVTEGAGQTEEDALKTLATQIASGSGPDVLVMDGIPYDEYVEKGVLKDLTEVYTELCASGNYFDNVLDCFYRDEKIYTIPAAFQLTILMGEAEKIEGVDNLEKFASLLEETEVENTSKIGLLTEDGILTAMGMVSADTWINERGGLDEEALNRFLMLCQRIYDADRAGMSGDELQEEIRLQADLYTSWGGGSVYDFKNENNFYCLNALNNSYTYFENPFIMGSMGGNTVSELNILLAELEYLEKDYRILSDGGTACTPVSMLAVNQASRVQQEAESFLEYILGAGFQENAILSGIPINRDALYAMEENDPDPYGYRDGYTAINLGSVGVSSKDCVILSVDWASPEEFQKFNDMLDRIDRVNIRDDMVYGTVMELGVSAVNGEKSIEETVDEIAKKVQLYLAE